MTPGRGVTECVAMRDDESLRNMGTLPSIGLLSATEGETSSLLPLLLALAL